MQQRSKNIVLKCLVLYLVALVSGCGSNVRSDVKPGFDNISGIYRYAGLGQYAAEQFPNPLIDLSDINEGSDVTIVHNDRLFEVAYFSSDGAAVNTTINLSDLNGGNVVWRNSMLTTTERIPVMGAPILPLPAKHTRGSKVLRGEDGNLYIIGFFREKGLFFTDYWEHEIMLVRIE